jgi:hypothetical protein
MKWIWFHCKYLLFQGRHISQKVIYIFSTEFNFIETFIQIQIQRKKVPLIPFRLRVLALVFALFLLVMPSKGLPKNVTGNSLCFYQTGGEGAPPPLKTKTNLFPVIFLKASLKAIVKIWQPLVFENCE